MRMLKFIVAVSVASCMPSASGERPGRTSDDVRQDVTPNTTRLVRPVAVTQATYAATHHKDRPHAVALVRNDRQADAMLAASRVTHFPVNAPVLFVDADGLPSETRAEIERLAPDGNTYDRKVQAYLVGPIGAAVRRDLEAMGLHVRAFSSADPFELSEELDRWAADVHADHPDEVAIVQYQHLVTGLPAVAWNAHMGSALLFVDGETIPDATRRALDRRFGGEAYIYLFGDSSVISDHVAAELARHGHVQRIRGANPSEIAVAFAGYRDAGINQGYWLFSSTRDFGWGLAEPGHNFTFVNPADWQLAVTGSLLSHLGKHGPMLLLPNGAIDDVTRRYLESVKPHGRSVRDELVNHGWILGTTTSIARDVQGDLDLLLGD
jgi:hypothetical protein